MSSASVEGVQPSGPLREPPVTKAPAGHRRSHLGLEPAPRVTYKGSEKQGGVDVEKRERASPRAAVIRSASGDGRRPRGRAGLGPGGDPAPAALPPPTLDPPNGLRLAPGAQGRRRAQPPPQ